MFQNWIELQITNILKFIFIIVLSKNEKIVQYLIAHGADVDAKAEGGLSAYGLSLSNSNSTISNMIRSNSDDESLSSKSSGRKFSDGSTSPSSLSSLARMSIEEERDDLSPIVATVNTASFNKNRRSSSTPDLKQVKFLNFNFNFNN